ncbi:MAG: DUF501 domain-containing protein [Spirochaetota bacterium]|nr:DUF501 domain-containing protein [Spirochaetota bacterium]
MNLDSSYCIFQEYNENDINIIKWQLECKSVHIGSIIERCRHGFPFIILLNPKKMINGKEQLNYEALSNLMWLTCPYLNDKIHIIESVGGIQRISEIILSDNLLTSKMEKAHANFYFLRSAIFHKFIGENIPQQRIDLFNTGIGGIRNISMLKCLHMHFSHFRICEDNIAGLLTFRLLEEKCSCDEVLCEDASKKG